MIEIFFTPTQITVNSGRNVQVATNQHKKKV